MEKLVFEGGNVELLEPEKIMLISFVGDIDDEEYKRLWTRGVDKAIELNVDKFIFDQSSVGKVSFRARGWVILKMLPRIKNELGSSIKTGVISAKNLVNKSGLKYIVGMFEKMASLKITFYPDIETARKELL